MVRESGVKNMDAACEEKLFPFQFPFGGAGADPALLRLPDKAGVGSGSGRWWARYRHTWMPGLDPD